MTTTATIPGTLYEGLANLPACDGNRNHFES